MAIEVITFDLWGTVLWPRDTEVKQQRRMALLLEIAERAGERFTPELMLAAWKASFVEAEEETRRTLLEMGPPGRWRLLCRLGYDVQPTCVPTEDGEEGRVRAFVAH